MRASSELVGIELQIGGTHCVTTCASQRPSPRNDLERNLSFMYETHRTRRVPNKPDNQLHHTPSGWERGETVRAKGVITGCASPPSSIKRGNVTAPGLHHGRWDLSSSPCFCHAHLSCAYITYLCTSIAHGGCACTAPMVL